MLSDETSWLTQVEDDQSLQDPDAHILDLEVQSLVRKHLEDSILGASRSTDLIMLAKQSFPEEITDRLEEIFAPIDPEDDEDTLLPELIFESLQEFVMMCNRLLGGLDVRFVPGRTFDGEIEVQLFDDTFGDASIRFCRDRTAMVAVISEKGKSCGRIHADATFTAADHFNLVRWI